MPTATPPSPTPKLKVGTRVFDAEASLEGSITWANAASVKIRWDDGEQATLRRDALERLGITLLAEEACRPEPPPPPTKSPEQIQAIVDEMVRRYGSNLRNWGEFPRLVAEAGLQPQDVTDERLSAAGLKLHQAREQLRERIQTANADPASPLLIVLKGDPELDPTLAREPEAETKTEDTMAVKQMRPKAAPAASNAAPRPRAAGGKVSALDAAAQVLAHAGQPLSCKEMIAAMATQGLWTSPGGKTPDATLYSAILREINAKGAASRFVKAERGKFAYTGV